MGLSAVPGAQVTVSAIVDAISKGAPAYNARDYEGCLTLYAATTRNILDGPLGPCPARMLLARQLREAGRAGHPLSGAWELRAGFDGALVLLRGGSSLEARCVASWIQQLPRDPTEHASSDSRASFSRTSPDTRCFLQWRASRARSAEEARRWCARR